MNHGKKGDFMRLTIVERWKASRMSLDMHSYYRRHGRAEGKRVGGELSKLEGAQPGV